MMGRAGSHRWLVAASVIWTLIIIGGLAGLWAYAETPGPAAAAAPSWPAASGLPRDEHRPTLVMFLHPQCACSRASIEELAVLLARVPGALMTHVVVYRPAGSPSGWEHSDLWDAATALPGVHVTSDEDGEAAGLFGAVVSGSTLLYDADGRLLFNGGVTWARGHAGDNEGLEAVVSLVRRDRSAIPTAPVFGCLLHAGRKG